MKYVKKVISRPVLSTEVFEHELDWGDTFFVSLREYPAPDITIVEPPKLHISNLNPIFIHETNSGIFDVKTEGVDLVVTIRSRDDVTVDTLVEWTITHGGILDPSLGQLEDTTITHLDGFDYNDLHRDTVVADIPTLTGVATILAGTSSVVIQIPTVDDTVFTGGKNTFKRCTITLDSTDNADTILHTERLTSVGLIEDSSVLPVLEGTVQVSCRMNVETNIEPLTGSAGQETFTLGVDALGSPNLATLIIDDTPLESIVMTPVDILAADATDLTNGGVYYQVIIKPATRP